MPLDPTYTLNGVAKTDLKVALDKTATTIEETFVFTTAESCGVTDNGGNCPYEHRLCIDSTVGTDGEEASSPVTITYGGSTYSDFDVTIKIDTSVQGAYDFKF